MTLKFGVGVINPQAVLVNFNPGGGYSLGRPWGFFTSGGVYSLRLPMDFSPPEVEIPGEVDIHCYTGLGICPNARSAGY